MTEISSKEMEKTIKNIYNTLDKVSPVDFDCGKLCGEVCCTYDADDYHNEELALYLLPGEELMYLESDSFELYYIDSDEIAYPHSWKGKIYLVKCKNPPKCDRSIRPIQCRTFPLIPHISKDNPSSFLQITRCIYYYFRKNRYIKHIPYILEFF